VRRGRTSERILAEPSAQPALDRVENLRLDSYRQLLGFDLPPPTNLLGLHIAQSTTLVDTLGFDSSRVAAVGTRRPISSPRAITTVRWAPASWHHRASTMSGRIHPR
jgi:hypothetical protein